MNSWIWWRRANRPGNRRTDCLVWPDDSDRRPWLGSGLFLWQRCGCTGRHSDQMAERWLHLFGQHAVHFKWSLSPRSGCRLHWRQHGKVFLVRRLSVQRSGPSLMNLRRSAFIMTLTEDSDMAAAAKIGLRSIPKNGYKRPAATGTPTELYTKAKTGSAGYYASLREKAFALLQDPSGPLATA